MSSSTSAWYPAGWSRQRLLHATSSDLTSLPNEEKDRMFDSLRAALGPDGFKALMEEMSRNYKARLAAEAAAQEEQGSGGGGGIETLPPHIRAPFLATLQRRYGGEAQPWGFVVYRLVSAEEADEARWDAFWSRWQAIADERMRSYADVPGVEGAAQQLHFRLVTLDSGLAGDNADQSSGFRTVAAQYRALLAAVSNAGVGQEGLPIGLAHSVCLAVTEASLRSVLEAPMPGSAPRSEWKKIPYAVAVDRSLGEGEGEREGQEDDDGSYAGYFKVAVESLVDELFAIVGGDVLTPRELGTGLGERQVWCSAAGRHGIFTLQEGD